MKISIVHNIPTGGAKVAVYNWIKILKEKHTVDEFFLSPSDTEFYNTKKLNHKRFIFNYKQTKKFNKKILFHLNPILNFIDLLNYNKVQRSIAEKINATNYDIVFANTDYIVEAPSCLRYITKPAVYYMHSVFYKFYIKGLEEKPYNFLQAIFLKYIKWLDKTNTRRAELILTNSKFMQNECSKIYNNRAIVCKYGVDTNIFKPSNETKNYILAVGAIHPQKAHDFLIHSVSKIPQKIRPEVKIAYDRGDENYKEVLKNISQKEGVKISFTQVINKEEMAVLYNKALILACPQINEALGLVALEAMACKTPVIAIKEGGFKETIINNKTGLLVERNYNAFANAIITLLSNKKLANDLAEEGYKYVINNWRWDISAKKLEKIFYTYIKK